MDIFYTTDISQISRKSFVALDCAVIGNNISSSHLAGDCHVTGEEMPLPRRHNLWAQIPVCDCVWVALLPQNVTINKTVLIRFRIHSTTSKLDGKATDDKISFPIKVIIVSVRQREKTTILVEMRRSKIKIQSRSNIINLHNFVFNRCDLLISDGTCPGWHVVETNKKLLLSISACLLTQLLSLCLLVQMMNLQFVFVNLWKLLRVFPTDHRQHN